jgi:uncharacterized protein YkwD
MGVLNIGIMRRLFTLFTAVFLLQSLSAQTPFRAESIPSFVAKSSTDSIACIERLAAHYFHKILNNYRKEKSLVELHWNDTLWIAGMNHSLWMKRQHELTHTERAKTWYFTGRHVGDRVLYASNGNEQLRWSAENALYNSSIKGKDISAIALNMAKHAFEQWKGSPGHKKNMLKETSRSHGVSFIISTEHIWVTDVFAFNGVGQPVLEFPASTVFKLRKLKVE